MNRRWKRTMMIMQRFLLLKLLNRKTLLLLHKSNPLVTSSSSLSTTVHVKPLKEKTKEKETKHVSFSQSNNPSPINKAGHKKKENDDNVKNDDDDSNAIAKKKISKPSYQEPKGKASKKSVHQTEKDVEEKDGDSESELTNMEDNDDDTSQVCDEGDSAGSDDVSGGEDNNDDDDDDDNKQLVAKTSKKNSLSNATKKPADSAPAPKYSLPPSSLKTKEAPQHARSNPQHKSKISKKSSQPEQEADNEEDEDDKKQQVSDDEEHAKTKKKQKRESKTFESEEQTSKKRSRTDSSPASSSSKSQKHDVNMVKRTLARPDMPVAQQNPVNLYDNGVETGTIPNELIQLIVNLYSRKSSGFQAAEERLLEASNKKHKTMLLEYTYSGVDTKNQGLVPDFHLDHALQIYTSGGPTQMQYDVTMRSVNSRPSIGFKAFNVDRSKCFSALFEKMSEQFLLQHQVCIYQPLNVATGFCTSRTIRFGNDKTKPTLIWNITDFELPFMVQAVDDNGIALKNKAQEITLPSMGFILISCNNQFQILAQKPEKPSSTNICFLLIFTEKKEIVTKRTGGRGGTKRGPLTNSGSTSIAVSSAGDATSGDELCSSSENYKIHQRKQEIILEQFAELRKQITENDVIIKNHLAANENDRKQTRNFIKDMTAYRLSQEALNIDIHDFQENQTVFRGTVEEKLEILDERTTRESYMVEKILVLMQKFDIEKQSNEIKNLENHVRKNNMYMVQAGMITANEKTQRDILLDNIESEVMKTNSSNDKKGKMLKASKKQQESDEENQRNCEDADGEEVPMLTSSIGNCLFMFLLVDVSFFL